MFKDIHNCSRILCLPKTKLECSLAISAVSSVLFRSVCGAVRCRYCGIHCEKVPLKCLCCHPAEDSFPMNDLWRVLTLQDTL